MINLKPIFVSKIWGGNYLKNNIYPNIVENNVGEAWLISCVPGKESIINEGQFKNKTLQYVWQNHPELFNNNDKSLTFPLLIKIIDANNDLSIQVHPNNEYAKKHLNLPYGKSECWYILNCKDNQKLILGHNAKTLAKAKSMILNKDWKHFIRKINIKKHELFDIQPGTIHAICSGTLIYELQQASDTTFRLYDYDRLENGKLRDLHIKESLEVISAPQIYKKSKIIKNIKVGNNKSLMKILIKNQYFTLYELDLINDNFNLIPYFKNNNYLLITCIDGHFNINNNNYEKGDSFIITYDELNQELLNINGICKLLISISNK